MAWPYSVLIGGVLGLAVLAASLAGRVFGPIDGLLGYPAVLLAQGYQLAPAVIPKVQDRDLSTLSSFAEVPATGVILPIATVTIGRIGFRLSDSGTRRLMARVVVGASRRAAGSPGTSEEETGLRWRPTAGQGCPGGAPGLVPRGLELFAGSGLA